MSNKLPSFNIIETNTHPSEYKKLNKPFISVCICRVCSVGLSYVESLKHSPQTTISPATHTRSPNCCDNVNVYVKIV